MIKTLHIFAIAALGKGLSGSDRIFIEFSKILKKNMNVKIYLWKEGYEMCKSQDLFLGVDFKIIKMESWCDFGFLICYVARIIKAIWLALTITIYNDEQTVVYSASEFWMDSLPAFILKIRFKKIKWVAAWFQTAPNPLIGFTEGKRKNAYKLSAFFYWFMQLPIKPLINNFADLVMINNSLEEKQFQKPKVLVVLGAVNMIEINKYIKERKVLPKVYDAIFQGRFHPQKGVEELIDIWKLVTKKLPKAKLAMIGDGPLMEAVKQKIKKYALENSIKLFGYIFDGSEKYDIFLQSKVVVHPAFFDSGGMAAAEAMAFSLPCIGFNLDSYQSYYPEGMIKVEVGDLNAFAQTMIDLLNNKPERQKLGIEAKKMIEKSWNWDQRVNQLIEVLN